LWLIYIETRNSATFRGNRATFTFVTVKIFETSPLTYHDHGSGHKRARIINLRATILILLKNVPRFENQRATKFPVAILFFVAFKSCHDEEQTCHDGNDLEKFCFQLSKIFLLFFLYVKMHKININNT